MKWIEQIHFQYTGDNKSSFINDLLMPMISKSEKGLNGILYLYGNIHVENELCIHIVHEKGPCKQKGSELGLIIKSALREFGLVRHSIWNALTQKRKSS